MLTLHPQIIKKNGRKAYVVLPYAEFQAIQEALDDIDDLRALRRARKENAGRRGYSLEEVKVMLGLGGKRKPQRRTARRR